MSRQRYTPERIIGVLREAALAQGQVTTAPARRRTLSRGQALQDRLSLVPLSACDKLCTLPPAKVVPSIDQKTAGRDRVNPFDGGQIKARVS